MGYFNKDFIAPCCFIFFLSFKPSEPYLTAYLTNNIGLSSDEVDAKVYPIYQIAQAIVITLLAAAKILGLLVYVPTPVRILLNDKNLIVIGALCRLATRGLLLFGTNLFFMQIMQVTYAIGGCAKIVFTAYCLCIIPSKSQQLTALTQASLLFSNIAASLLSDLILYLSNPEYRAETYRHLMWISFVSVLISCLFAIFGLKSHYPEVGDPSLSVDQDQGDKSPQSSCQRASSVTISHCQGQSCRFDSHEHSGDIEDGQEAHGAPSAPGRSGAARKQKDGVVVSYGHHTSSPPITLPDDVMDHSCRRSHPITHSIVTSTSGPADEDNESLHSKENDICGAVMYQGIQMSTLCSVYSTRSFFLSTAWWILTYGLYTFDYAYESSLYDHFYGKSKESWNGVINAFVHIFATLASFILYFKCLEEWCSKEKPIFRPQCVFALSGILMAACSVLVVLYGDRIWAFASYLSVFFIFFSFSNTLFLGETRKVVDAWSKKRLGDERDTNSLSTRNSQMENEEVISVIVVANSTFAELFAAAEQMILKQELELRTIFMYKILPVTQLISLILIINIVRKACLHRFRPDNTE